MSTISPVAAPVPLSWSDRMHLLPGFVRRMRSQFATKRRIDRQTHDGAAPPVTPRLSVVAKFQRIVRRARNLWAFLARIRAYNLAMQQECCDRLRSAVAAGVQEAIIYGDGEAAVLVAECCPLVGLPVTGVCLWGLPTSPTLEAIPGWPETALDEYKGHIILATFVNSRKHLRRLVSMGVSPHRVIFLEQLAD